jgi:hypothetical protein
MREAKESDFLLSTPEKKQRQDLVGTQQSILQQGRSGSGARSSKPHYELFLVGDSIGAESDRLSTPRAERARFRPVSWTQWFKTLWRDFAEKILPGLVLVIIIVLLVTFIFIHKSAST